MSQKSKNNVKPPTSDSPGTNRVQDDLHKENLHNHFHGENNKSLQDDKKIGQHNQAGRPPLMKK